VLTGSLREADQPSSFVHLGLKNVQESLRYGLDNADHLRGRLIEESQELGLEDFFRRELGQVGNRRFVRGTLVQDPTLDFELLACP
jgi:hypothetical protein